MIPAFFYNVLHLISLLWDKLVVYYGRDRNTHTVHDMKTLAQDIKIGQTIATYAYNMVVESITPRKQKNGKIIFRFEGRRLYKNTAEEMAVFQTWGNDAYVGCSDSREGTKIRTL